MSNIIIRIQSDLGFLRLTVNSNDTIQSLRSKISSTYKISYDDFLICTERHRSTAIKNEHMTFSQLGLRNGTLLYLSLLPNNNPNKQANASAEEKKPTEEEHHLTSLCRHGSNQRCIHCSQGTDQPLEWLCQHGPGQMCPNCAGVKKDDKIELEMLCLHEPNAFCTNCLPASKPKVKHQSFAEYMKEKQMDCKHGPGEKCIYCLPPLLHTYTVNMNCPKHMPYPRGLCSSCAPEACILQRQPYRHVDHIEFSDRRYFDLFCNAYIEHDYKPMMGFLYGKYVEYQHHGYSQVKACVYSLYIPNQNFVQGKYMLLEDAYLENIDFINNNHGLEVVGLIYSHDPHDTVLSSDELLFIASYQLKFQKEKAFSSQFVTVGVTHNENKEVIPDGLMISDQGLAMFRDGLFVHSDDPKLCKVQKRNSKNVPLSTVIVNIKGQGPKEVTTFETEFLIVQLTVGMPKKQPPRVFKSCSFPPLYCGPNELTESQIALQTILMDNEPSGTYLYTLLHDLNLLAYLAQYLDVDTLLNILYYLKQDKPISLNDYKQIRLIAGYDH